MILVNSNGEQNGGFEPWDRIAQALSLLACAPGGCSLARPNHSWDRTVGLMLKRYAFTRGD
jgi:hypothetical protein